MWPGQTICLPKTCATYTMDINASLADGRACWTVAAEHNLTLASFLAYNPTVDVTCSNLATVGPVVCVSSPDGAYVPTVYGSPVSSPSSDGGGGGGRQGEYADAAVMPPGPAPFSTTRACGGYYQVQVADTCQRVSIAAGVGVELFELINPSIDSGCTNLVPGLWYCVHPVIGWNLTNPNANSTTPAPSSNSSIPVPPPAPTPPGTTSTCYAWHVVVAGDTCVLLNQTLGVGLAELAFWNPDLRADCGNLLLGGAYCVAGPPLPANGTPSQEMPSSTSIPRPSSSRTPQPSSSSSPRPSSSTSPSPPSSTSHPSPSSTSHPPPSSTSHLSSSSTPYSASSSPIRPSTTTGPSIAPPSGTSVPSSLCKTTYAVKSGDSCYAIWTRFGLSEAQFRHLNPGLNANCDLDIGQMLCVAAPEACPKTYTVKSGDSCYAIWTKLGLTEGQLRKLNPSLDENCNLDLGQVLCVAG